MVCFKTKEDVRWMAGCFTGRKNTVIEAAPSAIPTLRTQSIWCLPPLDRDRRPWALPAITAMLSLALLGTVSSGVFVQGMPFMRLSGELQSKLLPHVSIMNVSLVPQSSKLVMSEARTVQHYLQPIHKGC